MGAWLALYVPTYALTYGWLQFLQLCNVMVLLTSIGILRTDPLLISVAALVSPVVALLWLADLIWLLLTRELLHGGTAYLFDPHIPLIARALSFYHLGLPLVQFRMLRRLGYDSRALPVAVASALALLMASASSIGLHHNLNYSAQWPNGFVSSQSPLSHAFASWLVLSLLVLLPGHLLWTAILGRPLESGR